MGFLNGDIQIYKKNVKTPVVSKVEKVVGGILRGYSFYKENKK